MTTEELMYIREMQRDFQEQFGRPLYIDVTRMKGVPQRIRDISTMDLTNIDKLFLEVCNKYRITRDAIKTSPRRLLKGTPEWRAAVEFSAAVLGQGWSPGYAAKLIGRDRSLIYYYGKYIHYDIPLLVQ
jgi:hypothetical protein